MPEELIDFKDEVTTIINFGKTQKQVLYNAQSTPTWVGREGEEVIAYVCIDTNIYKIYNYYYASSAWRYTIFQGETS